MAVTTPDDLWSPDDGSEYNIPADTAAMQDTVQAALTALRASIPSLGAYRTGTNADRLALSGAGLTPGLRYWTTDTRLDWVYDGAKWLVAPGQVLGSMESSASPTAPNALIGTIVTVSGLSVGQRLRVISSPVSASLAAAGTITFATAIRNNAAAVTAAAFDKSVVARTYAPAGSLVSSIPGVEYLFTTTSTANVTAALFNGSGNVYGADGQRLMIVSA